MIQLTLFDIGKPRRVVKTRNPYHDHNGKFCTRVNSKDNIKRQIIYWRNKAEMYERMYLAVTKRLTEGERIGKNDSTK